jgi:murein L,D-transpeptidase YcbB/YkuD
MRRVFVMFCGFAGILFLAGCATTRSAPKPSLENRVQVLEEKVQSMESDLKSAPQALAPASESPAENTASVEKLTNKQIQKALKNAGYYDGNIDGKMGRKTRAAIKEFQRNNGLKADGIVGRNTREKLLKYLS